jgi:hypothetical protein
LNHQLPDDEPATVVIVRGGRDGRLFTADQQRRLTELMDRWRTARDSAQDLSDEEREELDMLIEREIRASAVRSAALLDELAE